MSSAKFWTAMLRTLHFFKGGARVMTAWMTRSIRCLILTMRGTPQLYYGDEIAMQGDDDPDNRRDFPGGFPADGINAFTTRNEKQRSVFDHQKLLGQLRAEFEPLRRGNLLNLFATEHQYVYARNTTKSPVIVALNNDTRAATVE